MNQDALFCFVVMPFGSKGEYDKKGKESKYIFKHIICKGIEKYGEEIKREINVVLESDKKAAGSITRSILENIIRADICIIDITGLNANVFFELGIRYSLRDKITILLRQSKTDIPFDIHGFKCITYDCFKPDVAIQNIFDFLKTGFEK